MAARTRYRAATVADDISTQEDVMEEVMDEATAGSGLAAERTRRLGLLDEMRATGTDPYPYRFDRTHDLNELRSTWGGLQAGKIGRASCRERVFGYV